MSKYADKLMKQIGHLKGRDVARWTKELKDAQRKERVKKEIEDTLKHRRIAKEIEELI